MAYRKSFLSLSRPLLCGIVFESQPDLVKKSMKNTEYSGASAIAVHTRLLPDCAKTVDGYRQFISSVNIPVMIIHYRDASSLTDEGRSNYLLNAAHAGASIVDVMGDLFCPSPRELTLDKDAIARQKELIDHIHSIGSEVIMSSHMPQFLPAEQVLEHLSKMQERGADIVKIVYTINTQAELEDALKTTLLLKRELKVPFVHLCNGVYGIVQRYAAPLLGSALSFGVHEYKADGHPYQFPLHSLHPLYDNMYAHVNIELLNSQADELFQKENKT